jgi:hypothetical protein
MTKHRRKDKEVKEAVVMQARLWIVKSEIDRMARYLRVFEDSLETEKREVEKAHEEANKGFESLSEDEQALLDQPYLEDYWEAGEKFPQLLLISFIIAWFAFVEQHLLYLCERVGALKPEERKGTYLKATRPLFKEKTGYEIDQLTWNQLMNIQSLRNIFVHGGREISWSFYKDKGHTVYYQPSGDDFPAFYIDFDPSLFSYLKRYEMVELTTPPFEISPTFEYCNYLVEFGTEFFTKLINDLLPVK